MQVLGKLVGQAAISDRKASREMGNHSSEEHGRLDRTLIKQPYWKGRVERVVLSILKASVATAEKENQITDSPVLSPTSPKYAPPPIECMLYDKVCL